MRAGPRVNDQGREKPLDKQEADALVAKNALEFLDNRLNRPAPVFAFVNFGAMHEPYYYARIDDDKFKGASVPRTPAFNEESVADKPAYVSNLPTLSNGEVSELDQSYRKGLRSLMRVDRFMGSAIRPAQAQGRDGQHLLRLLHRQRGPLRTAPLRARQAPALQGGHQLPADRARTGHRGEA